MFLWKRVYPRFSAPDSRLKPLPQGRRRCFCGSGFTRDCSKRRQPASVNACISVTIIAMTLPPHSRNLRVGRVSEIGRGYLITTVTQGRLPLFADLQLARLAIRELRACDEAGLCSTLAFVTDARSPALAAAVDGAALPDLLRRFKSLSGGAINRSRDTPGRAVWQGGFHDQGMRDGADLQHIARYIVANPVRAGWLTPFGNTPLGRVWL